MAKSRLKFRDIYVDFGVRKPHTVLVGFARKAILLNDLGKLRPENCKIFVEDGCPKQKLFQLIQQNRIFIINGKHVKKLREKKRLVKSDLNDVFAIQELARNDPGLFREMTRREKDDLTDQMIYVYYCRLTSLIVCLKNYQWGFAAEFGRDLPELQATLKSLDNEKKRVLVHFKKFSGRAAKTGIKGLGPRYLGGILIKANPAKFKSLSAYLGYIGLKGSSRASGRYSRHVLSLYHQLSVSAIMHKDREFYPLYLKIKSDLSTRFPTYPRHKIDGMARNRVSTFLAKRIYASFRWSKTEPAQSPMSRVPRK